MCDGMIVSSIIAAVFGLWLDSTGRRISNPGSANQDEIDEAPDTHHLRPAQVRMKMAYRQNISDAESFAVLQGLKHQLHRVPEYPRYGEIEQCLKNKHEKEVGYPKRTYAECLDECVLDSRVEGNQNEHKVDQHGDDRCGHDATICGCALLGQRPPIHELAERARKGQRASEEEQSAEKERHEEG